MSEQLAGLPQRAKAVASGFAAYSAFGSFALYVLGYLALRFHLTVLGVGTDLSVLDERYLFAGARFLVYVGSTLPIAILVAAFLCAPLRLLPASARRALAARWQRALAAPTSLAWLGAALALLVIQLVMRQCFVFADMLVGHGVPTECPGWLRSLFLDGKEVMPLYFSGLLLAILLTAALWGVSAPPAFPPEPQMGMPRSRATHFGRGLLGLLVAIEALLLPVNFGVLVLDKSVPRVGAVGASPLADGDQAWLVWEGKEAMTYFVTRNAGGRSLVTVPRADVKRTEITAYDRLPALLELRAERAEGDAGR